VATSVRKADDTRAILVQQLKCAVADLELRSGFYDKPWTSYDEALQRVHLFKDYVENDDGYKLINRAGKPFSREDEVQLFFGLMWCRIEFDVNREVNNGREPVDFKVSYGSGDKSLIEFKLASNTSLKRNLERQIEICTTANRTNKELKVIICNTAADQAKVAKGLKELNLDGEPSIVVIDARNDNSPPARRRRWLHVNCAGHRSSTATAASSRQERGRRSASRRPALTCRDRQRRPRCRPVRYNKDMHFTLDGEPFELTPELVRSRLTDHVPDEIREYWVEIDGVRWPVKQVISIATGARRTRFQSQDSRRWLQNLGFPIGQGASGLTGAIAPRSAPAPRDTFDASTLEPLEPIEVSASFTWLRAGALYLDAQGLPVFPALPRQPGLYRFDFGLDDEGVRVVYIGESVSLRQRASNYRNAKTDRSRQRTSRRIHKEVVAHLSTGGAIEFAIATEVLVGAGRQAANLRLRSARRLAENAAVLAAQLEQDVAVLNIDADLPESNEVGGGDDA
jgi:hypothetical protein